MRVLFSYIGGLGHFYPLVPIARAVVRAGHEVAVAGSGRLTTQVEALGFQALATSPPRPADEPPPMRDVAPLPPADARAAELEFAQNFADKGARRHATRILEHCRDWQPDVVVRDEADFGSAIAAEVCGLPVAQVLVLAAGTLIRPDLVTPRLDAVRAEHGLPPDPGLRMLTRGLVLSPFPPSFRSPASPVPLPADVCAYRAGPHVEMTARPGRRPRIYLTLGTVFSTESGDLFERLLAGVAGLDADVLVTVGHHIAPTDFGPQPDHVRIERFVPQDEVLGRADLVVSHGGSGALLGALTHGLPSVLLPLGADQPHNARRAVELGLARTLDAATATSESIRETIQTALADEEMADRARAMADECAGLPDVEATVALLEALSLRDEAD
ncbi:MAG TPA: glycosyltransferase [Nocardioides sp.]|uniref:glycosyltransferase n=1 Tax=Nocardioides sp. TaxID=35761 RepID=UPI002D80FDDE|nr:glycosyltransferase [Nocardioides sp.]HET6653287.1 glycosyltransferase [Nocardioides sp.]